MKRVFSTIAALPAALWWLVFICWIIGLWICSSLPGSSAPSIDIPHFDKVIHFTFFFVGSSILTMALLRSFSFGGWKPIVLAVVFMAGVGVMDEWHQTRTPGRQGADSGDWIADCLGALSGALVTGAIYARIGSRKTDI